MTAKSYPISLSDKRLTFDRQLTDNPNREILDSDRPELDKRVTTVEGAVGSKAFRRNENKPAVDEPVAEMPKPGWQPPSLIGDPVQPAV